LIVDKEGDLYGTTFFGGEYNDYGTVFKMSPSTNGAWSETVLHSFSGSDGFNPEADVVIHGGSLYGTTRSGGEGVGSSGVVYQVRP
jgi:uncharacterized repeat protein (TIGR03803 family)